MLADSHFDCPEAIYEILLTSFVFLRGIRPFHDGKGAHTHRLEPFSYQMACVSRPLSEAQTEYINCPLHLISSPSKD